MMNWSDYEGLSQEGKDRYWFVVRSGVDFWSVLFGVSWFLIVVMLVVVVFLHTAHLIISDPDLGFAKEDVLKLVLVAGKVLVAWVWMVAGKLVVVGVLVFLRWREIERIKREYGAA